MNAFLRPTEIIDWQSPSIRELADELAAGLTGDEAVARRCFFWVRDQVRHSVDYGDTAVTCTASEVLRHRTGFCFAKSHLLAALLRARQIPAALCYQRLALDDRGTAFCLHGLVAVFLERHGWYRVDPRGAKPGTATDFAPPFERLVFTPKLPGELDIPDRFPDPLPSVVEVLRRCHAVEEVLRYLPDCQTEPLPFFLFSV